jgi:chemotaxis protein histidine kinase CheA
MNSGSGKTDIIEIFTADAGEHLQTINDDLLALEQNKEDLHLVDKIFRDVHAIKGSAGMVGFSVVSQFSHKIEDLLAKIRDHKLNLSESIIDLLFHAVDMLTHQVENISHGQKEEDTILAMFDDLYAETLISAEMSEDQEISRKKAPPSPPVAAKMDATLKVEPISREKTPPSPPVAAPSAETKRSETELAELYTRQELFDKAVAIYHKILRDDPSNKTIRQILEETVALQAYVKEIASSTTSRRIEH